MSENVQKKISDFKVSLNMMCLYRSICVFLLSEPQGKESMVFGSQIGGNNPNMGIRGMETYLEKWNASACYSVNIKDIIIKARNNGENTTIVVDGMATLRYLYGEELPWIPGGQMKQCEEQIRDFAQQFLTLGAKLVFMFDGSPAEVKITEWKRRRLEKMEEISQFFDTLNFSTTGYSHYESRRALFLVPANMGFLVTTIVKNLGCKVVRSIGDCDEEIARYAYQNNCLAIISQDTDFVIYRGAKHYWSIKHFNKHRMTTMEYDGRRLARSLELSYSDLPLLATLMGNDLIKKEELSEFHRRLVYNYYRNNRLNFGAIIRCVATFIRSYPPNVPSTSLDKVAEHVFNDSTKLELLQKSINSYDITQPARDDLLQIPFEEGSNWHSVLLLMRNRHLDGWHSQIYGIGIRGIFHASVSLEDYRCTDLPLYREVMRKLRQKMYGILLFDKPVFNNEEKIVKELVASDPSSLEGYHEVPVIHPQVFHPGLITLWTSNDSEIMEMRWALLCSSVSMDHKALRSSEVPPQLFCFVLAFQYLLDEGVKMLKFELDAFVSTAVLLRDYTIEMLKKVPLYESNSRGIRLHSLVSRAYSSIILLNSCCNHPIPEKELNPTYYQDGKLFQYKYAMAKDGISVNDLCERNESSVNLFQTIRNMLPKLIDETTER